MCADNARCRSTEKPHRAQRVTRYRTRKARHPARAPWAHALEHARAHTRASSYDRRPRTSLQQRTPLHIMYQYLNLYRRRGRPSVLASTQLCMGAVSCVPVRRTGRRNGRRGIPLAQSPALIDGPSSLRPKAPRLHTDGGHPHTLPAAASAYALTRRASRSSARQGARRAHLRPPSKRVHLDRPPLRRHLL